MTKEEAWLVWMNATKTTDTPVETDFKVIKRTSWWAAFEAGWDAAAVNVNGWDQAYEMGRDLEKKEWVGLDGEIPGLGLVTEEFYNGMIFAEDILRERNGG